MLTRGHFVFIAFRERKGERKSSQGEERRIVLIAWLPPVGPQIIWGVSAQTGVLGLNPQPRAIELQPFVNRTKCQPTEPHQPGLFYFNRHFYSIYFV